MFRKFSLVVLASVVAVVMINSVFAQNENSAIITSEYVIGDLNGDSRFDSLDFALMKKYLLGMIKGFDVEDELYVADVNDDGLINSADLAYIKRMLLGLIAEFPKKSVEGFAQVACGESHTIALKKDGTV